MARYIGNWVAMQETVYIESQNLNWKPGVISVVTTHPGTLSIGDRVVVNTPATGAFTGHEFSIATYNGEDQSLESSYTFEDALAEDIFPVKTGAPYAGSAVRFTGSAWTIFPAGGGGGGSVGGPVNPLFDNAAGVSATAASVDHDHGTPNPVAISATETIQPVSPSEGDTYLMNAAPPYIGSEWGPSIAQPDIWVLTPHLGSGPALYDRVHLQIGDTESGTKMEYYSGSLHPGSTMPEILAALHQATQNKPDMDYTFEVIGETLVGTGRENMVCTRAIFMDLDGTGGLTFDSIHTQNGNPGPVVIQPDIYRASFLRAREMVDGDVFRLTIGATNYDSDPVDAGTPTISTSTVVLGVDGDIYTLDIGNLGYWGSWSYTYHTGSSKTVSTDILAGPYGGGAGNNPLTFTVTTNTDSKIFQYASLGPVPPTNSEIAIGLTAAVNSGTKDLAIIVLGGSVTPGNTPTIDIAGDPDTPYSYTALGGDGLQQVAEGLALAVNAVLPPLGSTTYNAMAMELDPGVWGISLEGKVAGPGHVITPTGSGTITMGAPVHIITGVSASAVWTAVKSDPAIITLTAVTPGIFAGTVVYGDNSLTGPDEYEGPTITVQGAAMDTADSVAAGIAAVANGNNDLYAVTSIGAAVICTSLFGGESTPVGSSTDSLTGSFVTNTVPGTLATMQGAIWSSIQANGAALDSHYNVTVGVNGLLATGKTNGVQARTVSSALIGTGFTFMPTTYTHIGSSTADPPIPGVEQYQVTRYKSGHWMMRWPHVGERFRVTDVGKFYSALTSHGAFTEEVYAGVGPFRRINTNSPAPDKLITLSDRYLICTVIQNGQQTPGSGNMTVTLPLASTCEGLVVRVLKMGFNDVVSIALTAPDTPSGSASAHQIWGGSSYDINVGNNSVEFLSMGADGWSAYF